MPATRPATLVAVVLLVAACASTTFAQTPPPPPTYTCEQTRDLLCNAGQGDTLCNCVLGKLGLAGDALTAGKELCLQQVSGCCGSLNNCAAGPTLPDTCTTSLYSTQQAVQCVTEFLASTGRRLRWAAY